MQNNNNKVKSTIKVVEREGVISVSIQGSGKHYSVNCKNEPKGKTYTHYFDVPKRGTILKKLGLWNGQNSKQSKRQES